MDDTKKKAEIPRSSDIAELAAFWETHDFNDYEDQMERVDGPVFARSRPVSPASAPKPPTNKHKAAKKRKATK